MAPLDTAALIEDLVRVTALGEADSVALFHRACTAIVAAGVPVARAAMQLEYLHPEFYGYCLHWRSDQPAHEIARSHAFAEGAEFQASPYMASLRARGPVLWRLDPPDAATVNMPLLARLAAEGFTALLADIVPTSDRLPPGISWATRAPGGFAPATRATLESLTIPLCGVFRALAERRMTAAVLATYLGPLAGGLVARGVTRRGQVEAMEAVVLMVDLRGFTAMSLTQTQDTLVERLNRFFGAVADAVADAGGEVLKFLGDGVLAVFPVGPARPAEAACRAAARAIAAVRMAAADPFVAALALGALGFGNVGGRARLDFTVLGPAVNLAARIETVAKASGEPVLMDGAVAEHLPPAWVRPAGLHTLPGFSAPRPLFALTPPAG